VTDAEADVKTRETDVASNQKLLDTLSGRLLEAQKQLASIHVPPAPLVASRPVPMPLLAPPTGVPMMRAPRPLGAPPGLAPVGVAFSPIAHAEAQAHLDALEKQLAAAEEALKRTEIRAATDGIVSTIVLEAGQPVTDGATVATISRPETESVVISVPHTDAQRIKPGQACQIQLTGNSQERFAGVVSGFQSQGSAAAGAQVQVKLQGDPNALFQLPPNTQLQATIDTSGG
jgi:multidrug efflux pump subunit AcrA (membrane-fusion protein)